MFGAAHRWLPAACAECLAHSHRHEASPGAIGAEVGGAQVFVARTQAIEEEVMRDAELESFGDIDSGSP